MNASDLAEIEGIKRLKARYFRLLDTKQWDAWRELFTDDFTGEVHGPHPVIHFASPVEMVATNRKVLSEAPTVHHGHMPEIDLTGPDSAKGVWAMVDVVKLGAGFVGYGHYHEEYRKQDGHWRISRMTITRLHVEQASEPPDSTASSKSG
ncbi:MAG: nuclear transport factor 2 family protein [Deltaproteobacteria bacterium]|nr:nuclear transport factor 2 family protein [Deltaproteobacteria bacterium]